MNYPSRAALRRQEIKARKAALHAERNRRCLKRDLRNGMISPEGLLVGFVAGAITGIVASRPPRTPDSDNTGITASGLMLPLLHILLAKSKETLKGGRGDDV